MAAKKKAEPKVEPKQEYDPWDEMVPVILHKDSSRYSEDQFVGVNGKFFLVKRGVRVNVPRPVFEVLMDSIEADATTADSVAEAEEAALKIL